MVNICNYIFVTECTTQRVNLMCLYVCTHTHKSLDLFQRPLRLHPLPHPSFYSMCFSFNSSYDLSSSLLFFSPALILSNLSLKNLENAFIDELLSKHLPSYISA